MNSEKNAPARAENTEPGVNQERSQDTTEVENGKPLDLTVMGDSCAPQSSSHDSAQQPTPLQVASKISDLISKAEFFALAYHLHNGNGPHDFVMGITHKDGTTGYYGAKRCSFDRAVSSSWESIIASEDYPFTVAVRSKDASNHSCWAALDIDAHAPEGGAKAKWTIQKLWPVIRAKASIESLGSLAIVVEHSGRGFHVWFLSSDKRAVSDWRRLLRSILSDSGLSAREDGIELYPPREGSALGPAMRLPGSANVNTWNAGDGNYSCSLILFESGLVNLVRRLPPPCSLKVTTKEVLPFVTHKSRQSGREPAKPKALAEHVDARRILESNAIKAESSRHNAMLGLIGDGLFHFSRAQLRSLAGMQYEQANPRPQSEIAIHLVEFDQAYDGIHSQYPERLSKAERCIHSKLRGPSAKAAFVIVQNYARHAAATRKWGNDHRFPLSGLDLATRLGVEMKTAYRIRNKLVQMGCIRKVADAIPTVEADKFIWILPLHDPPRVPGSSAALSIT
jgi:hypothetical protein